jgi:hypothetical protein
LCESPIKVLPGRPQESVVFLRRAADATVDSRLRALLRFAIQALENDEPKPEVAYGWVDRALRHIDQRLASRRFARKDGAVLSALSYSVEEISACSVEEITVELRARGYAVIVYTPKKFFEGVEDLDLPDLESSEWLAGHREALEKFQRDQLRVLFRNTLSGWGNGGAEPNS